MPTSSVDLPTPYARCQQTTPQAISRAWENRLNERRQGPPRGKGHGGGVGGPQKKHSPGRAGYSGRLVLPLFMSCLCWIALIFSGLFDFHLATLSLLHSAHRTPRVVGWPRLQTPLAGCWT